ncbi:hypothetical protein MAR_021684 [Mya arenaria]|uniref:Uncharacterized protein n=1 Tax=Mya arenaria TaxID=6604 RepID=A0ABY7E8Z6_MYAAR|nr:hypothetical protein MAR_021684 [Mya arenaria]
MEHLMANVVSVAKMRILLPNKIGWGKITDDAAHGKPVEKTVEPSTGNRNQPPLPNIVVQQGPRKDDTPLERKDALPPLDSTVAVGEDGVVQKSKKNKKKKDKTI